MRQQKEPDEAKRLRLAHYRQGQEQAIKSGAVKLIGTDYVPPQKSEPEWIAPYQAKILAMTFAGIEPSE
jgi:hypothetical protein